MDTRGGHRAANLSHWDEGGRVQQILTSLGSIPPLAVYAFIFAWLAAESTGFPVPNEVVLILAGSLAGQGRVSPLFLVVSAVLGSLLGANIAYAIGQRGGRQAVLRFGRVFRLNEARLDAIEAQFARAGAFAIFLARLTPFVRTVASFPAGMLRLPRRTFELATLFGSLLWCTVMVTIGNLLGANYEVGVRLIEEYTIPAILVVIAFVAAYVWIHVRLDRRVKRPMSEEERESLHARESTARSPKPTARPPTDTSGSDR